MLYLMDSGGEVRPAHYAKEYVQLGPGFGAVQGITSAFPVVEMRESEWLAYRAEMDSASAPFTDPAHPDYAGTDYRAASAARALVMMTTAARYWAAATGSAARMLATGEEVACD